MNTKNRLIKKLLGVGKRHRVLTYPVLALVAVISVISNLFSWSTGAGKRVVAVVMVMVMLVSQSYFLTSSATEAIDDEHTALVQQELQQEVMNKKLESEVSSKSNDDNANEEKSTEVASDADSSNASEDIIDEDNMSGDVTADQAVEQDYAVEGADASTDASIVDNTGVDGTYPVSEEGIVDENAIEDEDLDSNLDPEQIKVEFYYQGEAAAPTKIYEGATEYTDGNSIYNVSSLAATAITDLGDDAHTFGGCFSFTTWFTDANCTIAADVTKIGYITEGGVKKIKLYAKRNMDYYKVKLEFNANTNVSGMINSSAIVNNNYYKVSVDAPSLTITGLSRTGYNPVNPTVTGGGGGNVSGDVLMATFTGASGTSSCERTLTLNWEGKKYNLQYSADDSNTVVETQEVQYGNTDYTFKSGSGIAADKEGWVFSGWYIGDDKNKTVTTSTPVSTYEADLYAEGSTDSPVILHPTYEYAEIELYSELPEFFTYKEKVSGSKSVKAKYKNKTEAGSSSGNFTYTITSDPGLADYGITLSGTGEKNGIIFTVGENGPTKITNADGLTVGFDVTDSSLPAGNQVKHFEVKVVIKAKTVNILDSDAKVNKPYDGTDAAALNKNTLATDTPGVTVNIDNTKAKYNSPNVAEANSIILDKASTTLTVPDGEDANNYVLNEYSIPGTISVRNAYINTFATLTPHDATLDLSGGYVRAGEADPKIGFEEDTTSKNDWIGLLDGETLDDLGVTLKVSPSREDDLEKEGTYSVLFDVDPSSNYMVRINETGKFTVKHQSPTGLYAYDDGGSLDSWHIAPDGVTISPKADSGYDTVLISRDGGATFPTGSNKVTEDDTGKVLKIKLYDSVTGAVTSSEDFTTNCDATPPQFAGYTVLEAVDENGLPYQSGTKPGLYFPGIGSVLDFGTYIKSTMTIKIKYTDDTSKVVTLHYGLFGDSENSLETPFDSDGVATITIVGASIDKADLKAGIIRCYATDTSGNSSAVKILSPLDNNDKYEWSVEAGAPEVGTLFVYAGEDKSIIVADQSAVPKENMAFYNHCEARLTVTDSVSGLEKIVWNINGAETTEEIHDTTKKSLGSYTHVIEGANSEVCTVYATVYDNAGNSKETNKVVFRLDDVPPVLNVDYNDQEWTKDTTISFTTSDDLSGVNYAKVTDADGNTIDCNLGKPNSSGEYTASFEADKKGTYSVMVADKAGNISNWTNTVTKISTEAPPCPTITIDPAEPNGENGWYNAAGKAPVATITNPGKSADDTPVITQYRLWKEGETGYNDTPIDKASVDVPINDEGVFNLKAWTKSVSGVECANYDKHVEVLKVDRTAPDISISTEKGNGSSVIVHFTVSDAVSGVNDDSIVVMHGDKNVDITKEATSTGIVGTFEITEKGNYTITAIDNAGNESDQAAFTPMTLKVKAVTNITDTGATLGANVIKGTFDIKSAAIAYRKASDNDYTEAETAYNVDKDTGNAAASTVLTDLTPNTPYVFKVTAVSDANEVLEYEGYFKTLATDQSGIDVTGTAKYADDSKGNITIGLFEGNVCMMAEEITAGSEFTFYCVPDGNYSITATDGTYSKTTRLLIEDGMVIYPTQYIELVLSGQNTSVVITTDNTPNITADDMDSIFLNDKVNFTKKDSDLIDNGGTVEFKLYATLMTVSSVSADEISAMYAVTNKNKVVGAYLDLSLYKIVTDANGDVERSRVTNLANPAHISVTIPLGDLAGKPDLEVVRIHNDGENFLGASLPDNDSNPSTYTVVTDQFSTYAILYSIAGASTEAPTTAASEQPTTSSVVVQPTTSQVIQPTTSQVVPTTQYSYEDPEDEDDEDVKEIKDKTKKPKSSSATSVGTLTSSGSAKTGDETPIVLMFALMMISCGVVVVLRKKYKDVE